MIKPASLRAHLTAANPELQRDPDKLLVFTDEGSVVANATPSLSFEYRYTLNLIVTDYPGTADAIIVPLLAWMHVHQHDMLGNPDTAKTCIRYEVDFNNHDSIDLSIKLTLTEAVAVQKQPDGRLNIRHLAEPQRTPDYEDVFWSLYDGDSLLAQWQSPAA